MQFHEFGDKGNKTLLVMHGMLCDWRKFREIFMPLEQDFRVIYPAMNGCYDGAPDFKSFADECAEIEKYIVDNYNGQVNAVIGVSQGATLMAILASRNVVTIKKAILDGVYVAHQGKLCADLAIKAFLRMQKNGGVPSKAFLKALPLMGLDESDLDEFKLMYWGGTRESMKANLIENYTWRVPDDFRIAHTKVLLWCGSKEPYAKKSHEILKKHIADYEERIFDGYGHGQKMMKDTADYLNELRKIIS
jgi:pimeloyl-ACP methyl ester carboxylesterase